MPDTRFVVLLGSLRTGSVNRQIAELAATVAPDGITVDIVDGLDALPFYNEDLDGPDAPTSVTGLRERVAAADRVLVVTPEYNGTMPAVLNNAIDWLSRPYGAGAIVGKPLAAVGATPTPYGGKWAHEHTRHSAGIAGAAVVEDVVLSHSLLEGDITTDQAFRSRLREVLETLVAYAPEPTAA